MKEIHSHAYRGNVEALRKEVKEKGEDVNCRVRKESDTPLHCAAANGQSAAVEFLLKNGADPYAQNEFSSTPLFMAVGRARMAENEDRLPEYYEVFKLLLQYESHLRNKYAKMYLNTPSLKNIKNSNGFTPVTWLNNRPQIQQKLLEIIAQVEQDRNEITNQGAYWRNTQPPVRLMPDSTSPVKSAYLWQRPAVASAAEEKPTDAAQPVNTDSHIKHRSLTTIVVE